MPRGVQIKEVVQFYVNQYYLPDAARGITQLIPVYSD